MTGTEEYVPAETQTQKVQIPVTMHERLASIGNKAMGIDPEQGMKFLTASEALRKTNDPMEKAARFGKFFNEIRTLPIKAKQALLGSMAQTPEWKQLFGNADIAGAMETAEGTISVPARNENGEIIGYNVLSPDGSKWNWVKPDTEKGGVGQFKDFQKMSPEEQAAYLKFEQAKNPKHFVINDTSGEWDRRQEKKDLNQFKKDQQKILNNYKADVLRLRSRYDASTRSGIAMTAEDWNAGLQEIYDLYDPQFREYGVEWGKASGKQQTSAGGKDQFGYTIGQTATKGGVTYKYLGNDKWQKQ
jgi:hypothetical protein